MKKSILLHFSSFPTSTAGGLSMIYCPNLPPCFKPQLAYIFIIKISLSLCPPSCAFHPNSHYDSRQVRVFKITKNMPVFPLQPCCLFPPITSASLKYFLEGSRVSAELKAPWPSNTCFSVFRATYDQGTCQDIWQESLSHLRQSDEIGTKGQGKPNGGPKGVQRSESCTYLRESTGVYAAELNLLTNGPLQEHSLLWTGE